MPSASSSFIRVSRSRVSSSCPIRFRALVQLAQAALHAGQAQRHDRDVDQNDREEHDVRGRDVAVVGAPGDRCRERGHLGGCSRARPGPGPGSEWRSKRACRARDGAGRRARSRNPSVRLRAFSSMRVRLASQLIRAERREQQRHRHERDEERERHLRRQVRGAAEHARVQVGGREAHGEEVHRHERARDDREHRRVARLALGVLDREAQRLVGRVEQHDDQERDERRLAPHPPVTPRAARPDRAGDQRADAEDQAHVDRHVGAQVPTAGRACAGA